LKKLFLNLFIFSFPLLTSIVFFVIDDPFGVFYKEVSLVESCEDVVKTRMYLESDKKQYSAFIFGNSRIHGFSDEDWKKHIGAQNIMHYGSPGESLLNIQRKLELILEHQRIKDILISIDAGILNNTDNSNPFFKGPVYNHTPLTSNVSYFEFYSNYIRYYFTDLFFLKHMYYRLTGSYERRWMENAFEEPVKITNEIKNSGRSLADSLIETDFAGYKRVFKPDYSILTRKVTVVSRKDIERLKEIRSMLEMNNIRYKIVVPPDFGGNRISDSIHNSLKSIFKTNFYDLSGPGKISNDSMLYYENLHFTRKAGALMLDSIYSEK
jgi:hypothetical protein